MFKYFAFCFFVVLCVPNAESNVCSRDKLVRIIKQMTYLVKYVNSQEVTCSSDASGYKHYSEEEDSYKCIKSVTKSKIMTRSLAEMVNKTEYFCCPGYSQIENLNSSNENDIVCQPICNPPCQGGRCVAPEKCQCLPGYIPSLDPSSSCWPVCDLDCGYGVCVSPNTCSCFPGYELTKTDSHAVCAEIRYNETGCSSGYIRSDHGVCEPKCSDGCIHGTCIAPEVCQCNQGFHLDEVNNFDGLKVCRPDCDSGYKKIGSSCHPECDHSCGNGTCILPNVCECFRGFKIDIKKLSSQADTNGVLCIPSCKYCLGECIAPNTCITSTIPASSSSYISKRSSAMISQFYKNVNYLTNSWSIPPESTTPTTTPQKTSTRLTSSLSITPWLKNTQSTTLGLTSLKTTSPRSARLTIPLSTSPWSPSRLITTRSTTSRFTTPRLSSRSTTENQGTNAEVNGTITVPQATSNPSEGAQRRGEKTWVEQHWASILLAVLLTLFALIVILIVWRRKPIIHFLRAKSYTVEEDVPNGYDNDQQIHYSKRKDHVEYK